MSVLDASIGMGNSWTPLVGGATSYATAESAESVPSKGDPGTPPYWLAKLNKDLDDRQRALSTYDAYYEGRHPLAFASEKFRSAFGGLFREFADNWCDLVVDATAERLHIDGFRLERDAQGDDDAWRIWQTNFLDADSQLAHTEALVCGVAFALVWPGPDGEPEISVEHATETVCAYKAGSRRTRAAALKRWVDDSGYEFATLYLPEEVWKYRSTQKVRGAPGQPTSSPNRQWVERTADIDPSMRGEPWPLPNKLGLVPVVPLVNRPRMLVQGVSELKRVIPIQDAINKLLADMLVASEFQSFRQRWLTGMELQTDPETKQVLEPFKSAVDRLWQAENPDAHFGEFAQIDLTVFVKAMEMVVQHLASQTRTPPHYFALTGQFPSGESIKSAETGLVAKVRNRMLHFGENWEEVMRLAFLVRGDAAKAANVGMETMWADPESRTESEHVDATVKLKALNIPNPALWERIGLSQTEISRFKEMQAEETALVGAPPPPDKVAENINVQE